MATKAIKKLEVLNFNSDMSNLKGMGNDKEMPKHLMSNNGSRRALMLINDIVLDKRNPVTFYWDGQRDTLRVLVPGKEIETIQLNKG